MAYPTVTLDSRKRGDTFPKVSGVFDAGDNIDLQGVGTELRLDWFLSGVLKQSLSIGSGITVTGTKTFEIDEIAYGNNTLPAGDYTGDFELTDSNGIRTTLFEIKRTILEDSTI